MTRNQTAGLAGFYNPERAEGESFKAYKQRRAASQQAASRISGEGLGGGINSRKQLRDSMRQNGTMGLRTRASDAILAAIASKRVPNWKGDTDKAGAYTLIGRSFDPETGEYLRRKWLAGVSAQRGY